jgi:hypothetical protein
MGKSSEVVRSTSTPSVNDGEMLHVAEEKHRDTDIALDFVERHEGFTYTSEQERAVVRKIDVWLMPLVRLHSFSVCLTRLLTGLQMFASYCLQYMDKSVMAQAAIYDLVSDLKLVGQDYSWCS